MATQKIDLIRQSKLIGSTLNLQVLSGTETLGIFTPNPNPVALEGVATGVANTDAVNVGQLNLAIANVDTSALSSRITTLEGEVDQLQIDVPAIDSRVATAEGSINQLLMDVPALSSRIDSTDATIVSEIARLEAVGTGVIDTRIQAVVGAAPAALDTLVEIANLLGDDTQVTGSIVQMLTNDRVDINDLQTRTAALEASTVADLTALTSRVEAIDNPTTGTVAVLQAQVDSLQQLNAVKEVFVLAGGETTLTLAVGGTGDLLQNSVAVVLNGIEQEETIHYTVNNTSGIITLVTPADWVVGDRVVVRALQIV